MALIFCYFTTFRCEWCVGLRKNKAGLVRGQVLGGMVLKYSSKVCCLKAGLTIWIAGWKLLTTEVLII